MCEFCVKHGEGKKWYLNAKNYSNDLLSDIERRTMAKEHVNWLAKTYRRYFGLVKALPYGVPLIGPALSAIVKNLFIHKHWGQIVPIEDVEKILNFTNSITRIPCVCRKCTTGKEVRTCFLISADPAKMGIDGIIDLSSFGGPDLSKFEVFDKENTLNFFKECELSGMVHSVWTVKAPFAAVLCNCDYVTGCISMKLIKEARPITFKAEYIADINTELCTGCGECVKICQFGAVSIDSKSKKARINLKKCQGCGVCRVVCKNGAIYLLDRSSNVDVANLW